VLSPDFVWVPEAQLVANDPVALASCGVDVALADDVRALALKAIGIVRSAG